MKGAPASRRAGAPCGAGVLIRIPGTRGGLAIWGASRRVPDLNAKDGSLTLARGWPPASLTTPARGESAQASTRRETARFARIAAVKCGRIRRQVPQDPPSSVVRFSVKYTRFSSGPASLDERSCQTARMPGVAILACSSLRQIATTDHVPSSLGTWEVLIKPSMSSGRTVARISRSKSAWPSSVSNSGAILYVVRRINMSAPSMTPWSTVCAAAPHWTIHD